MAEPFDSMVSGIAATEEAVRDDLEADLQAQGSAIANVSPFSPFFRLLAAIFAAPVLYLRGFVIDTFLPGIFATKATGALLVLRAADMDEEKKPAAKMTGLITFFRAGSFGDLPIPLGTAVETDTIDGVVYRVVTTVAGLIPDGQSSAKVAVEAEATGAAYNLGDGYYSALPDPVPGITQVKNEADYILTPGADIESDADLQERLRLLWLTKGDYNWTAIYRSIVSDLIGISPGNIYFDETAPRGPGSADIYLITDSGLPDAALVTQADDLINVQGFHGLGDDVLVKAMPALKVDIDVTLTAVAEASAADKTLLRTDAENLLRAAFRETAAYPTVPRVAPFERLSRSALAGHLHAEFPLLEAVDWTAPVADPEPTLQLPVIRRATLDAAAVIDEGGGKVGLPATAHGFPSIGARIVVDGTVNYDGIHTIAAGSTANKIVVTAAYVAEVLTGAEQASGLVVEVAP